MLTFFFFVSALFFLFFAKEFKIKKMRKYIFTLFVALVLFSVSAETRSKDRIIPINEVMLKNMEYLTNSENPDIICHYLGTVDCPNKKIQVLYYW